MAPQQAAGRDLTSRESGAAEHVGAWNVILAALDEAFRVTPDPGTRE